jgi:hypothetical protein
MPRSFHIIPIIPSMIPIIFPLHRILQDLRETFKALDVNSDGFLTVTELRDGIEKAGEAASSWAKGPEILLGFP